jgi:hypothetical protein
MPEAIKVQQPATSEEELFNWQCEECDVDMEYNSSPDRCSLDIFS